MEGTSGAVKKEQEPKVAKEKWVSGKVLGEDGFFRVGAGWSFYLGKWISAVSSHLTSSVMPVSQWTLACQSACFVVLLNVELACPENEF